MYSFTDWSINPTLAYLFRPTPGNVSPSCPLCPKWIPWIQTRIAGWPRNVVDFLSISWTSRIVKETTNICSKWWFLQNGSHSKGFQFTGNDWMMTGVTMLGNQHTYIYIYTIYTYTNTYTYKYTYTYTYTYTYIHVHIQIHMHIHIHYPNTSVYVCMYIYI